MGNQGDILNEDRHILLFEKEIISAHWNPFSNSSLCLGVTYDELVLTFKVRHKQLRYAFVFISA